LTDGLLLRIFEDLPAHAPDSRAELGRRLEKDRTQLSVNSPGTTTLLHSISHCALGSGYAIAAEPPFQSVGFDLEDATRILRPIVERVATPEELLAAPDYRALWVAKEAAFKALNRSGAITVMAQARILDWKVKDKTDYFSVFLPTGQWIPGEGFFSISGNLILGIFYARS